MIFLNVHIEKILLWKLATGTPQSLYRQDCASPRADLQRQPSWFMMYFFFSTENPWNICNCFSLIFNQVSGISLEGDLLSWVSLLRLKVSEWLEIAKAQKFLTLPRHVHRFRMCLVYFLKMNQCGLSEDDELWEISPLKLCSKVCYSYSVLHCETTRQTPLALLAPGTMMAQSLGESARFGKVRKT